MEIERLSIPHTGIYRRGLSPSRCPQAFLPTVPNIKRIASHQKKNLFPNRYDCSNDVKNDQLTRRKSRVQVGATNRCRHFEKLNASNLLASTQKLKATQPVKKSRNAYLSSLPSYTTIPTEISQYTQQHASQVTFLSNTLSQSQSKKSQVIHKSALNASLEKQIDEMRLCENYVPLEKRSPSPTEIFIKTMREFFANKEPHIFLYALDMEWELCEDAIVGSELLSIMFQDYQNPSPSSSSNIEASLEKFDSNQSSIMTPYLDDDGNICLSLRINNPLITVEVLAIALLSLYKNLTALPIEDVINIMVVAQLLKISKLIQLCLDIMLDSIKANTVGLYHRIAKEYDLTELAHECVSWLELKLQPTLSTEVFLSHISKELMMEIITSPNFFIFNEYSVIQMLCYWIFFIEQKNIGMPSWTTVVTWFMSISSTKPYLQTNEGRGYLPHFKELRLNGILDPSNVHEIQKMNLLPTSWLLTVLQNHYYSLQSGGDMNMTTRFETNSLRFGTILKRNTSHHSEVIALHGFYFELIASREDDLCICYMKRLRPTSSLLSFRVCERQTFSIRQDREVRYNIKVQWKTIAGYKADSLGATTQVIGFNERSAESQKLTTKVANTDLFVSFHVFFPPS